ncbi:MAG: 3-phosphoserine/phosphohydroxythreonine transaminase [Planctomycetota bacterium]
MTSVAIDRVFNFSAGPAVLPEPVLRRAQEDIWNLAGTGIGILEHSHRGKAFGAVLEEAEALCRKVGNIPDNYKVFFMQGGATSQCYLVPANLLGQGKTADYFRTGKWAKDSVKEARFYGTAHVCYDGEPDNFRHLPTPDEISHSDNPVYVHFTSNNTIMGTQWAEEPACPDGAFLVSDACSDIFSRPIDFTRYGLVYAGAQKNLGPSGTSLVVVREDLLENPPRELPMMQSYKLCAEKGSMPNTPPTFGIYLMGRVFDWILSEGGLEEMERRNRAKAELVYGALDATSEFFECHAREDSRSLMNVTFKTGDPELDARFVAEADTNGMNGLKGHRSVGGMRASMYNAFPREGADQLAQFIRDFAQKNG